MCQIALDIPSEILYDIRMTEEDAASFVRRLVALNFYSEHKISLGYCAQIADMDIKAFIRYLGENGISIFRFDNEAEFFEEMKNA